MLETGVATELASVASRQENPIVVMAICVCLFALGLFGAAVWFVRQERIAAAQERAEAAKQMEKAWSAHERIVANMVERHGAQQSDIARCTRESVNGLIVGWDKSSKGLIDHLDRRMDQARQDRAAELRDVLQVLQANTVELARARDVLAAFRPGANGHG